MTGESLALRHFVQADAARLPLADNSVDLVIGSPPYMDARSYGINAQRGVTDWIDFMLRCTAEAVRVSRGLVLWVVAGVTRKHCYWPGCEGLLYEWWKRGGRCWRPCYWHRVGICGSGGRREYCEECEGEGCEVCEDGFSKEPGKGPQWYRADIEYVLCFTKCKGKIPWADATVNGHAPKWAPGGEMSYRLTDGDRKNRRDQWGRDCPTGNRGVNGDRKIQTSVGGRTREGAIKKTGRRCTRGKVKGDIVQSDSYFPPVLANPGNLIQGIRVGGGLMGNALCHENEAPYPEKLAEWFIASHCPPEGIVLDPFSGSGTTAAAAIALGRHGLGFDIRLNQCELGRRRCAEIQKVMF